jgi:hypothetical protein
MLPLKKEEERHPSLSPPPPPLSPLPSTSPSLRQPSSAHCQDGWQAVTVVLIRAVIVHIFVAVISVSIFIIALVLSVLVQLQDKDGDDKDNDCSHTVDILTIPVLALTQCDDIDKGVLLFFH